MQPSYTLGNGQRESVYSENCLLTSTNKAMMSTELQSVGLQHGYVNQSYQKPWMSQTNYNLFNDPYVSPMVCILYNILSLLITDHLIMHILKLFSFMWTQMGSNIVQQVERTNGLPNFNPIYSLRDHRLPPLYIFQLIIRSCLFKYLQRYKLTILIHLYISGCSFQKEQYNLDLIVKQLQHIGGNDQRQQPESSNRHTPPYV